jgi:hypothetical protein
MHSSTSISSFTDVAQITPKHAYRASSMAPIDRDTFEFQQMQPNAATPLR